ncbi:MAG: hypothetical protein ACKVT0_16070 [Planctomycetaceae bacterium]
MLTRKLLLSAGVVAVIIYGGSLCWLSGFRTGYDEGETQAWGRARKAFAYPVDLWDTEEPASVEVTSH